MSLVWRNPFRKFTRHSDSPTRAKTFLCARYFDACEKIPTKRKVIDMVDYTGKYSGSGKRPLADGNELEDRKQDTDSQQPKQHPDFAGGRTAKKPSYPLQGD